MTNTGNFYIARRRAVSLRLTSFLIEHEALDNFLNNWRGSQCTLDSIDCIASAFDWAATKEGEAYWYQLDDKYSEAYND